MVWLIALVAFLGGALISGMVVQARAAARQAQSEAALRLQYSGADGGTGGPLQQSLAPINEKLQTLSTLVDQTSRSQLNISEQFAVVQGTAADLQTETRTLNRIFNNSQDRGTWGEMQLRRIVELSGMLNRVDFEEQAQVGFEGTIQRPDMVINLDQGRTIVLDSKFPLSALLASDTSAEPDSDALKHQGSLVRSHIDALSKKDYVKQFEQSPEFVVMFIPAESLLAAALRSEPNLFEYATGKNVIPATPTTLLALLRTIAMGWRNYELAENAQEILAAAQELADRLGRAYAHFDNVGQSLNKAVDSFNKTVGSWDTRLLPQINRIGELQIEPSKVVELRRVNNQAKVTTTATDVIEGAS